MGFIYQDISVEQRAQIGLAVALLRGTYGLVTDLARGLGTSRKFIYGLAAEVERAVAEAVAAGVPGPKPVSQAIVVDRRRLDRAILTLALVGHAPERAIADCLGELYEVEPSLGYISTVLGRASAAAGGVNEGLSLSVPQGEVAADELFVQGRPRLVVVAPGSLQILALQSAERADAPAWQGVLTHFQERGVALVRLASDGGKALAAAVAKLPGVEHRLDLWHALRHVGRTERKLVQAAYTAIEKEWHVEGKAKRMDRAHPMGGYVWQQYEAARRQAAEQIRRSDACETVGRWVREALEAVDPRTGRVRSRDECLGELRAATALLRELKVAAARELADYLDQAGPALLAYADEWVARLSPVMAALGEAGVRYLCREWLLQRTVRKARPGERTERRLAYQRAHLVALLHWRQDYPAARDQVVGLLEGVLRGSSLVECVNSWLRPYADLMKGLGERFLPLFVFYRNRHVFARGKRAGHSPLQLAGTNPPEEDWLDGLGLGQPRRPRRGVRSLPQAA